MSLQGKGKKIEPTGFAMMMRSIRKTKGYPLRVVSDGTGISKARISLWERSKMMPDTVNLNKLIIFYESKGIMQGPMKNTLLSLYYRDMNNSNRTRKLTEREKVDKELSGVI